MGSSNSLWEWNGSQVKHGKEVEYSTMSSCGRLKVVR